MKKRITLAALLLSVGVSAQKVQKPDFKAFQNLEVEKLETVCDCGDAFIIGTEFEIYFLINSKKYKYKEEKQSKQVTEWHTQMKAIQKHCIGYKKHSPEDIKKCPLVQPVLDLRDRTKAEFQKNK